MKPMLVCCLLMLAFTAPAQIVSPGATERGLDGGVVPGDVSSGGFTNEVERVARAELAARLATTVARGKSASATRAVVQTNFPNSSDDWGVGQSPLPAVGAGSSEGIETTPEGALARFGRYRAKFLVNANTAGAVEVEIPPIGEAAASKLRSHVVGLCYWDQDGESVLFAQLQDAEGEVMGPDRVIYRNALGAGIDLCYRSGRDSFEQDVILRRRIPTPQDLGLTAGARLGVITEVMGAEPLRVSELIDLRPKNRELGIVSEEWLAGEVLHFGPMRILPSGRAFVLGNADASVPTATAWLRQDERTFVVDYTPYRLMKAQIDRLPAGTLQSRATRRGELKSLLAKVPPPATVRRPEARMRLAQVDGPEEPGVVIDYILVSSPLLNINIGAGNKAGFAAVGQSASDYWNEYDFPGRTVGVLTNLHWSNMSTSGVGVIISNAPGSYGFTSEDQMYAGYVYPSSGTNLTVTVTNLPSNVYNFYVYGHAGIESANSTFKLFRAGVQLAYKGTSPWGMGWNSTNWEAGQQYVVFKNISVTNQAIKVEVLAGDEGNICINGMQIVAVGAVPAPTLTISNLINVNFAAVSSAKTGFAAVGLSTNDYWNGYHVPSSSWGSLSSLSNANRVATGAGLTVRNAPGEWGSGVNDGMFAGFIYSIDGGNITISLTNLAAGNYDFYLYGHASYEGGNGLFHLWSGERDWDLKGTTIWGSGWASTNWDEGQQYVVFRDVAVETNQPVTILVAHDRYEYANVNGMQIVYKGPSDTDGNGLPDAWEMRHFGSLNQSPTADPDNDGLSNLAEYRNSTDPTRQDTNLNGALDSDEAERSWAEDRVPFGSYLGADNDEWNWTDLWNDGSGWNGTTLEFYSCELETYCAMHVSSLGSGTHEHYFDRAVSVMRVNTGDVLVAYVNLDPSFPPTEVMLQWYVTEENGGASWEHRAFWGADSIPGGNLGTASRRYLGSLPALGTWTRLEIPASSVGLEGKIVQGMAFSLYGGRAAWDHAAKLNPDVDRNGIPDAWERQYFGYVGITASADPDNDGLSNFAEWQHSTDPLNPDTDYDGRTDGQEVVDTTDPLNAASCQPVRLGYWRFDNTNSWAGEQGQLPLRVANLSGLPSWNTNAVRIGGTNTANLAYRDEETNGRPNINCRQGSIRFWFRPEWNSGSVTNGTGPGSEGRLVEVGARSATNGWAMLFSTNGTLLSFITQTNGTGMTNLSTAISWQSDDWHQLVLTYSPTNTSLYVDGCPVVTNGVGISKYPSRAARSASGLNLGSDVAGNYRAQGVFEDLETFNYALSSQTVSNDYQGICSTNGPVILRWPVSQTVLAGEAVAFEVAASSPTPLAYQWRLGGHKLAGATRSSYSLSNAQLNKAGTYTVSVTNRAGGATSPGAELTVHVLPTFTKQPHSQTVCTNTPLILTVEATGTLPLSYQWSKDGIAIAGATASIYTRDLAQGSDGGAYSVFVANVAGSTNSEPAIVVVGLQQPPVIFFVPTNNNGGFLARLYSTQAEQFRSKIDSSTHTNNHPGTLVAQADFADSIYGYSEGCTASRSVGVNVSRLPPPRITPNGAYVNGPTSVSISLGLEDLTNLVSNVYRSELERHAGTNLEEKTIWANSLRAGGSTDEEIRTQLINLLRTTSEYTTKFGAPGDPYAANTNYFIEYSLDNGLSWGVYRGPFPLSGTVVLQARVSKAGTADGRSRYGYLQSAVASATLTNVPAGWLAGYFGAGFLTNASAGPAQDPDQDGLANWQEYLESGNPTNSGIILRQPDYFPATSPQHLINVEFANGGDAGGYAAAGFDSSDSWNFFDPNSSSGSAFLRGISLTDAGGANVPNARLWAFVGPYRGANSLCARDQGWGSFWGCWATSHFMLPCGEIRNGWEGWYFQYLYELYTGLECPPWLYWGMLSRGWQPQIWLPGFEQAYQEGVPSTNGVWRLATDGLTSVVQNQLAPFFQGGLFGPVPGVDSGARLYLTGLAPGQYRIFLYGRGRARVNGQEGQEFTWRDPASGLAVPYTVFQTHPVNPRVESNDYGLGGPSLGSPIVAFWDGAESLTNEPIWLPKHESRIAIVFEDVGRLTGLQVVKLPTPPGHSETELGTPAPSAWAGKRSVSLSWPTVARSTGYEVFRSETNNAGFVSIGTTGARTFCDRHLAPGRTYYYCVMATNVTQVSAVSSPPVVAQVFWEGRSPQLNPYVEVSSSGGFPPPEEPVPGITNVNSAPSIEGVYPLRIPSVGGAFQVPFLKLLKAADPWDPDGDSLTFKVTGVYNGSLTINSAPFVPETTNSPGNCRFNPNSVVIWTPTGTPNESGVEAFDVVAFDGFLASEPALVKIVPVPKTYLVGWGNNEYGSLGTGDYLYYDDWIAGPYNVALFGTVVPRKVKVPDDVVVAGHTYHQNGAAVTGDGSLWMWGFPCGIGLFGQGQPTGFETDGEGNYLNYQLCRTTPFKVRMKGTDDVVQDFKDVVDVALECGSVFVTRSDGSVWSWGENWGEVLGRDISAEAIPDTGGFCTQQAGRVTGLKDRNGNALAVKQVVHGGTSVLVLCEDGSVWWWGTIGLSSFQFSPTFDILPEPRYLTGDGVTGTDHELPQRLTLFDGEPRVVQISGACGHFALLKADGTVWELGYVPRLSFHAPPQGVDPKSCGDYCYFSQDPVLVTNLPSNIASIAADTDYTLALTEDGKVYAWGEGRGLFHYQWYLNWPDPVRIEGFKDITKLSTSLYTVLALDKYGQVWGWGDNSWGQLGIDPGDDPALSAFTSPIPLQGIDYARDIVAAGWTAFGIATLQQNRVTGLRGTGLDKKIRLDWKPFPRASYYEVRRSATNSGVGDLIGTTGKNTFFDTGILGGNGEDGVGSLTTNVGHFYTVTALVDREATQPSVPIWVCPVPPPGIPLWPEANGSSSTGAVGTCRSIRLEWVAAVGASEYQVYRWTAPSNPPVFLGSTRDCTWFDRTIASGSTNWFYYTVRAVNEAGGNESAPSTWARLAGASCPPAPTITGFEIPYNGQARLSWTQSTGGVPITGYRVKWYFGSKIPTETTAFIRRDFLLDPMDPLLETNGLTYSFTWDNSFGLAADLIFWCKVSALDEGEEGNDSALVGPVLLCVSCSDFPPPMGLRAEPGDKQVFLDWTDDPDAASYELEYRVYNSTNSQWIPVTNHIVENRFWQEGLTNEVTYEHHVRSWRKIYVPGYTTNYGVVEVNSTNWSQSVTSTPSASLRATNISFTAQAEAYDGMVYIHWESLTNRPPLLCFLERKPAGAPDSAYSLLTTTDYGLAYLDRDVVNGSTYTYRVNALDNHWNRTRRSVDAAPHPTATSFTLLADPGNGHVRLAWNQPYGVNQFHVRCALEPGGPYENLVTLSDRNEYVHRGLPNGVRYYYIVRATTLYGAAFDSNEASTVPMETNAPLSPESLNLTLGDGEILISWPSSSGAAGYLVKRLDPNIEVYSGPANACRYPVPSGTTNGTFTFGVYAYSRVQAMSTPPRTNSINYEATQGGLTGQVLLSIGSVDISSNYAGLVVNGPTNLVLRASVKANEAAGAAVYFYDVCCQKVIGQGEAPDAQVTWSQVPQGVHTVQARVTSELWSATGIRPGAVYSSELGCVTNKMTPELVMYQTGSSDLQLPAPGLPIIVSRSYNSRTTNNIGRLGKGWSANWDQAKVELASTLSGGWAQAGRGEGLWINQFYITETASHLVTVTLPGGATAYFGAQLTVPEGEDPRYPDSRVRLGFMPYGPNQGQLSCAGSENPSRLNVLYSDQGGSSYDWTVGPLNLVGDVIPGFEGDAVPFVAMSFLYTAPDGTRYEFARAGADAQSWLLSEVTDRNGNSLAYQYEGASTILTNIVHSNGRKVGFSYSTNGTERSVSVYDSIGGAHPVIRYKVQDELLREVHKLVDRASGCYETNWYEYASPNRLTDIYDGRLIRVLHNEYGTNSEGVCDGRLVLQVDALNRTNAFNLDPNNVLTIGRVVNGTNETVTVGHEVSGAVSEVRGATTNHLAYDGQGRLVAQIDVDGNAKTIGYDSANRPVSQSDELSHVSTTRYNPFGDPLYVADANQNTNRFEYSQEGNLVTSIDPAGVHTAMEYGGLTNVVGQTTNIVGGLRLSESRDAAGVLFQTRTEYEYYSVFGQTVNLPGELKRQTEKWVDASGQPVSGHCIVTNSFEYDGNGNRTAEIKTRTLANGAIQTIRTDYTFDPQGRLRWSVVSASGGETLASQTNSVFYDAAGKQAATIDSANRTNSFTYDAGGNLIQTLYPDGTVSRTTYDEQNRVLYSQERVRPDGNGTTAPATLNLYDVYGRSVRVERRAGVVLTLQSAALGTHFQGKTGATALMLVVSNPGTVVSFTRTAYDYLGRVKYTVDARGAVTESGYDAAGRRTTNRVWTSYTVPTTNVNAAISPSGTNYIDTVFGYDANGNQVWVCDGSGRWTTNYYDGANRLTVVEFPRLAGEATSRIRRTEYDGLGRRILETDEAGVQNRYFYDFRGLLTAVSLDVEAGTNALNSYYKYDELGNQTEQKDSLNRVTKFQYDALGRRTRRTLPDGSFETAVYEFVPGGDNVKVLRISRTDFRTNTIVSTHDCMDRVRTKVLPAVNPGESETTLSYIYSSTNGLLDRVEMFGQVARTNYYQFDELRRLVKKDNPEGVLAYTYGASLSLESLKAYRRSAVGVNATIGGGTVPDVWLGYCYDALGRLASVTNCALAAPNVTSYRYDAVGNLDTCEYPNGVKHVYSYDERNRLRSLALTHSTGSLLRRFDYDLDPTGQRRAVSEVEGAGPSLRRRVAYEYDVDHSPVPASKLPRLHRLTQESLFDGQNNSIGTVARTYDRVGNRTSQDPQLSFSPDESIPTQSFAFDRLDLLDGDSDPDNGNDRYDANGNTLKDADGIATGDRYDAENRLIQRGAGISIGYDHEGNRAWKRVGAMTTYYLLDSLNPSGYVQVLAEYSSLSNAPARAYAYGHDLLSQVLTGTQAATNYYGYDGLGSVRLLLSSVQPESPLVTGTTPSGWRNNYSGWVGLRLQVGSSPLVVSALGRWVVSGNSGTHTIKLVRSDGTDVPGAAVSLNTAGAGAGQFQYGPLSQAVVLQTNTVYFLVSQEVSGGDSWYDNTTTVTPASGVSFTAAVYAANGTQTYQIVAVNNRSYGPVSLRFAAGPPAISDTYDYDAYGTLVDSTGSTPNHYRFTGEQWDQDLGMYSLRARYYNPQIGRFWTMDTYEGRNTEPLSLHKYFYCSGNPVNCSDPLGKGETLTTLLASTYVRAILAAAVLTVSIEGTYTVQNHLWGDKLDGKEQQKLQQARRELLNRKDRSPKDLSPYINTALSAKVKVSSNLRAGGAGAWGATSLYGQVAGGVIHLDKESFSLDNRLLALLLVHEAVHVSQWVPSNAYAEPAAYQAESDLLRGWDLTAASMADARLIFPGEKDYEFLDDLVDMFDTYHTKNPAIKR